MDYTVWLYYVLWILKHRLNSMSNTIFRISPADLDAVWLPTSHFLLLIQNCVCQTISERKIFSSCSLFHIVKLDIILIGHITIIINIMIVIKFHHFNTWYIISESEFMTIPTEKLCPNIGPKLFNLFTPNDSKKRLNQSKTINTKPPLFSMHHLWYNVKETKVAWYNPHPHHFDAFSFWRYFSYVLYVHT